MSIVSCSAESVETVLQPLDLQAPVGARPFDPNLIVESAEFTDIDSFDVRALQRFLGKTPYGRASFLETYQSNGVRAADALISAARQYRINPLVFLVYAQSVQGLVGERNYPFPPSRVEYVFRCGCLRSDDCLPALAGFDRQVDCLGQALRRAIDDIRANETTVSGWGPGFENLTLDNVKVTPANDATAAIYERTPRVQEGRAGGSWIFWNVWNQYALRLEYIGPFGPSDGRWIGESCASSAMCAAVEGGICASNYPDGLCTVRCAGACPSESTRPETFCAKFPDGGYCLPICNPEAPACREGYACVRVAGLDERTTRFVCSPATG